jgi:hypothetical protein
MPQKKQNSKSMGSYTRQVRTDRLVMFAHPNRKVVPFVNTTPMTNINTTPPPRLRATACRASWELLMMIVDAETKHKQAKTMPVIVWATSMFSFSFIQLTNFLFLFLF